MYIIKIETENKQFAKILNSPHDVKRAVSTETSRRTSFEIQYELTVERKKMISAMFFSCENLTNMANIFT